MFAKLIRLVDTDASIQCPFKRVGDTLVICLTPRLGILRALKIPPL